MSVPNQTPYNVYTANGLTTVFTYEFYIISASDLQVSINGSVVSSGYTVSGVGNKDGGDITFLTPPASGAVVMLERVVPTYRFTDYQDNGDLLADTVNKDFDRIWMAIQRAFIDLGFALTRPFFGGPFNAKGYRIENLGDPVNDQDAATKKFVLAAGNTNLARTLRVPESFVDVLPSVAARRNSLLGWNSSGRPVPIFSMTETADLALKLASDIGAYFSGYKARTVYDRLSDKVTLTDYPGAVEGRDNDSTAAFIAAYATGRFVYVPAGDWSTSVYIPNQTFGEGRVWSGGDGLFPDAGERVITPGISHQRNYLYRAETWGNRERAAGWSLMVNNEDGRPAVSGFANDNAMANYVNFDQVALFVSMRGSRKFFYTTAVNTTYTEFTVTAPEINAEQEVKPGMLISTSHSPRFKGRVMAVDFDTNTIAVSRWVAEGNGADGQIPASGVRALINGADKLWAGNFNLFIDANSPAKTACGLEIDIISDGTHGNPVEGYTAVNANNLGNPFNYGFRAIGSWLYTVYADAKQNVGLLHVEPPTSAVRVDNLTSPSWAGSTVLLNTNYRQATSYLAKITTGAVTWFTIDSRGQRSAQIEAYGVVSSDTTISGLSPSIISCTNGTGTPITLSLTTSSMRPGQAFEIRARGGAVSLTGIVGGTITLNTAEKPYCRFHYDGVNFLLLTHSS
ncbi:phage tail fiber domain-containing protein [Raoultella ornithinolytica]|uniref:phage tail fiber domain-containing protein n=1 Tax=Raoultella ornithinolytica TaxID=54291 RepID=UPI00403DB9C2